MRTSRTAHLQFASALSLAAIAASGALCTIVHAEESVQNPAPSAPRMHFTGIVDFSSSLLAPGDPEQTQSLGVWAIPSLTLSPAFSLAFTAALNQDLTGERRTTLQRSDLGLGWKGTALSKLLRVSGGLASRLPLTEGARARDSLLTSLRAAPRLWVEFEVLGLPGLTAFIEPAFSVYFHEFQTATTGRPNSRWGASQTLNLSYAFSEKTSLSSSFSHSTAWTYAGNATSQFVFDQQLSHQLNATLSAAIGVSNSGSVLKPNGFESNLNFFDPRSAAVSVSVTTAF